MTGSVNSPEQIVNLALVQIGLGYLVGSLYEGSTASKMALAVYAQSRDELIEEGEWDFAERTMIATLLKAAPAGGYSPFQPWSFAYPPLPWLYEYVYPSDCVKVRSLRPQPLGGFNPNPRFNRYSLDNDNSLNPPQRVILCDVQNAILTYAGRVTNPNTWDAAFTAALTAKLVKYLDAQKDGLKDAAQTVSLEDRAVGMATAEMK